MLIYIMWPAHSSTVKMLVHPSPLCLIKSSSVRFVDPSSRANEQFNLQPFSFSIQNESHRLASFSVAFCWDFTKKRKVQTFNPTSLLEERRSPILLASELMVFL